MSAMRQKVTTSITLRLLFDGVMPTHQPMFPKCKIVFAMWWWWNVSPRTAFRNVTNCASLLFFFKIRNIFLVYTVVQMQQLTGTLPPPLSGGTSPYYAIELLQGRHSRYLAFLWFLLLCAFSVFIYESNEMQYDCFSFCDTSSTRSCSLLHSSNGSDVSWRTAASSCFDAGANSWPSQSSTNTTAPPTDVIPGMRSSGRRLGRLVLRYGIGDYSFVPAHLFGPDNRPQLMSLQLSQDGVVLLPEPIVLEALTLTSVYNLQLSSESENAAIIFELPIGHVFPAGTQQLELFFPAGAPLVSYGADAGPVQLTFATTNPFYVFSEALARYVLIIASFVLLLVAMCRHALADTTVYPLFDASIPADGSDWFGWVAVLRCAMRTESVVTSRVVWHRLPVVVKSSIVNIVCLMIACDPLAGAFAMVPQNLFLQFWSLHLMPWFRLTWMVGTTSWLAACMITCGDRGHMYADPRCMSHQSFAHHDLNESMHNNKLMTKKPRRSTWRIMIALLFFPSALYLCSVIAAAQVGQPSEPASFGTGHGFRMMGSVIGMEIWMPINLLAFLGFYRRTLYARFPNGVDDGAEVSAFGVPGAIHQGRVFVVAIRFLMPYCVWTSFFISGVYFGTILVVTSLLPSYYNGHLVEVLMCVLLGWTVALVLVPLRKLLSSHPPRPCTFPPPGTSHSAESSSQQLRSLQGFAARQSPETPLLHPQQSAQNIPFQFEPSVPLWCQVPWTSEQFLNLKSGLVPNCGYAFQSEVQEMIFENIQRSFVEPQLAVQNPNALVSKRSFFCWETAVRCLNMSKEAYNVLEGDRDIRHLTSAEDYEQSFCERCIVNRCCCCCFGGCGGCGNCGDDNDVDVTGGDDASTSDVIRGVDEDEHIMNEERHEDDHRVDVRVSRSSRRFTEVGAVARASRQSVANRRRRAESLIFGSRQQSSALDHDDNSVLGNREDDNSDAAPPLSRQDTAPLVCGPRSAEQGDSAAMNTTNINRQSERPPDSMSGPSSPTSNAAMNVAGGGKSLAAIEERPIRKNQIDVTRYGYELIRVLDIFGVRVVVAATPPGTSGRHPHLCISFRGTVNLRNALTDANARMLEHPEMLGGAEVHRGFWLAFGKLLPSLVSALQDFFFSPDTDENAAWARSLTSIVCTGHSLGGALAMLCAYSCTRGTLHRDIFSRLPAFFSQTSAQSHQHMQPHPFYQQAPPLQYFQQSQVTPPQPAVARVRCYTFGSPRLGNAYLSHVYNIAVPDTYRIINENDIVARVGLCWQEHAGREVRMNRDGDVVIEGTYLENDYGLTRGVGSSIKNHYLIRYGNSMDNCLCTRNLKMLSPDCCSFLMVHLDEDEATALASSPQTLVHRDELSTDGGSRSDSPRGKS
jgi:hypothetical protein